MSFPLFQNRIFILSVVFMLEGKGGNLKNSRLECGYLKTAMFSTSQYIVSTTLCTFWCSLRVFLCDCLPSIRKNTNVSTLHICVCICVCGCVRACSHILALIRYSSNSIYSTFRIVRKLL